MPRARLCLLLVSPLLMGAQWLPPEPVLPRNPADPLEARMGLTAAFDENRFDGALGAPIPLMECAGADRRWGIALETGSTFTLGKDGSFFPLQTFDGRFGIALEAAQGDWWGRVRAVHWSAHKADGDSTVAFRGSTFSREYVEIEIGRVVGMTGVYARLTAPWHAVPDIRAPRVDAGAFWSGSGRSATPMAALHLGGDREHDFRLDLSALAGVYVGAERRMLLGIRYLRGRSSQGQYLDRKVDTVGFELQTRFR